MTLIAGNGHPGAPGGEAEIRRLRRRVLELEETNRALHARNQALEAGRVGVVDAKDARRLAEALDELRAERDRLLVGGENAARAGAEQSMRADELQERLAAVSAERDEARATAETERKRADHHAEQHAAAVKELAQTKGQKGGRR